MLVSQKLKKINKLARTLVEYYWDARADFTMIGVEHTRKEGWAATVMFEFLGDGHPQYLDDPMEDGRLVLQAHSKTLTGALVKLEKRMLEIIAKEENV